MGLKFEMSVVEGWKTTSLPLLLRLMKSCGTPDTSRSNYYGGDIPFVTIEDMTACNRHLTSTIKTLTDEGLKNSNAWVVPGNSILYSIYATLGLPRINTVPVTTNQAILALINYPNKIDRDYLYYWFEYIRASVVNFSSQTTQSNLNATTVKTFLVDHPTDLSEQTKIAEVLSTVDRAIEQTEALIAKQQRIKTGLMQDLLTRGIDEHGNLRSEQTHKFKDSSLGRIPVEWEVKRLGESSEVCNSFRKPIAALVRENMKGDYPYYGPTGILDYIHEYRVNGKFVLIGEDGDHFLKFKTQEMTLLVEGKYNVNNHAHILQGKGNVLTEWLHLFFLHRDITLHLTRQGAGRFKLNKAALLELLLSVPKEPAEQDRILKLMNTLRQNQISSIENLVKLRSLKTALMQDLLTGKKRVTALLNDTEVSV